VRPAFRDVLLRFTDQWLGLSRLANAKKDATLYPNFSSEIQDALAEETRQFISSVLITDHGTVANLLTAPYTMVDSRLAKYYGFGSATGTGYAKATRPPEWGVGLLSQGSMLAVLANGLSTSPTRRGHLVRTTLMCEPVPPPPPTVNPVAEVNDSKTTRERYELHSVTPECRGCHQMMDPIGFAFEHLDSAGRYRSKENNFLLDDSATVYRSGGKAEISVKGPTELAQALAKLPEVNDCMGAYLAAYALGVSHDSAQCLVASAVGDLRAGTMSVVDFYVRMASSEHFRYRQ
jgi:hypothetical protein